MSISNTVYLVAPARGGWAVNNGADTLSHHKDHAEAVACARLLRHQAVKEGDAASVIDLGCEDGPAPSKPL